MNDLANLRRIVIDKTTRSEHQLAVVLKLSQQQLTTITSAVNQYSPAINLRYHRDHLSEQAKCRATATQKHQHQQAIDQEYSARKTFEPESKQNDYHR